MRSPTGEIPRGLVREVDRAAEPYLLEALRWHPRAAALLDGARSGDVEAVHDALLAVPNAARGRFVGWCFALGLPGPALRAALGEGWMHDHREVRAAAGTWKRLELWFRVAGFDVSALPDPVTLWRGTSRHDFFEAAGGVSWTTRREVACWFATRHGGATNDPLVLRRTVPRAVVLYFTDERSEAEAVVVRPARTEVDGDLDDWLRAAAAFEAEVRAADPVYRLPPAPDPTGLP